MKKHIIERNVQLTKKKNKKQQNKELTNKKWRPGKEAHETNSGV